MLTALHGFIENDLVWRDFIAGAVPVRTPLLPGHGGKPCPPDATLASVAAEVAAGMADGDDLLGYSLGGRVALQLALDHPRKVRRLVLISSGVGLVTEQERRERVARDDRLAQVLEEDGIGPFVSWWEANPVLKPAKPLSRKVEESLRCMRLNQDPLPLASVMRTLSQGRMDVLMDRLSSLTIPVLLITGATDRIYSERLTAMAKRLPSATLRLIPDAGHAVHRERPEALHAAVIEFLRA